MEFLNTVKWFSCKSEYPSTITSSSYRESSFYDLVINSFRLPTPSPVPRKVTLSSDPVAYILVRTDSLNNAVNRKRSQRLSFLYQECHFSKLLYSKSSYLQSIG